LAAGAEGFRMSERQSVLVRVFEGDKYANEWPPEKLVEAVAWLADKLEGIPEQYRSEATFEISSSCSYEDSSYAEIEISYWRPETDEEMEARLSAKRRREEDQRQRKEAADRALYEELRQKYEEPSA
jgi:hypothetical protein